MRLGPGPSAPRSPAVPNWRRSPKWSRSCAGSPASISSRATARVAGSGSSSAHARASAERSAESLISEARDDLRQQVAHALRGGLPGREHVGVVEVAAAEARCEVGDERQAEHLGSDVARCDHLVHRRHADEVGAEGAQHPDLSRRLVVGSGEAGVDALLEGRIRLAGEVRSEEHTSELQSLMRISYAVFCLIKNKTIHQLNDLFN